MIPFFKKILSLIFYNGGIFYEKISKPSKDVGGYNDLDKVLERYSSKPDLFSPPFKDLEIFLKEEDLYLHNDFKKIKTFLDVGCGNASYSIFFTKLNLFANKYKYYGIEIDEKIIDFCQKKYPANEFKVSKAEDIKYKDSFFDMVFCSGTLHYTLDNWKNALKEIDRVSNKFILITRLPITKYNKSFFVHQTVLSKTATENHYFKVINRIEFENYIKSLGLSIYKKDYSSEIYIVEGVNETIVLSNYLLIKKHERQ